MRDFGGVIVFLSIICPRNYARNRKKFDLSGAAFMFSGSKYFSKTINTSFFVCDCMKTSSKYVIAFLLSISGLKILLINAENAAGPMEIP